MPLPLLRGRLERKLDGYLGPATRSAGDLDRTAMVSNDTMSDSEPESGTAPAWLGREEGIEDSGEVLGRYAATVVANAHRSVAVPHTCRDPDVTAVRNRIARVGKHIHENLVERTTRADEWRQRGIGRMDRDAV